MKSVISGMVVSSIKRQIKNQDGTSTDFYENLVDFGDGAVILSSGKELKVGKTDFNISPKTMYDRKPKITPALSTPL